jgi:hypothetical protein
MHMMMSPIVAIVLVGPTAGTPSAHQACQKKCPEGLSEKDYAWIYDKNRSVNGKDDGNDCQRHNDREPRQVCPHAVKKVAPKTFSLADCTRRLNSRFECAVHILRLPAGRSL